VLICFRKGGTVDENIIELLRDLAQSHEGLLPDRCPLVEISDFGDDAFHGPINAFWHDEPVVRRMAAYAIGLHNAADDATSADKQAVPHLEWMLHADPDPLSRMYPAKAVWQINGSGKAIMAFVDGLKSLDVEARRHAVTLLGLVALDGQDTIEPLTATLDDTDLEVRTTAAGGLAEFGPAAREALPGSSAFSMRTTVLPGSWPSTPS
jgi:HEAT repeat protein